LPGKCSFLVLFLPRALHGRLNLSLAPTLPAQDFIFRAQRTRRRLPTDLATTFRFVTRTHMSSLDQESPRFRPVIPESEVRHVEFTMLWMHVPGHLLRERVAPCLVIVGVRA
jgi:hypothetical protein